MPALAVYNRKNPSQRFYSLAGYKNGFVISYTHSVNKGRVRDFYQPTKDNQLKLDKTIFVSYGAGIPEPGETPGAVFTVLEDGYQISNLNRVIPNLTMAVGIIANHAITFWENADGDANLATNLQPVDYYLTDYFPPQTSLILEIQRVSLLNYTFHKFK